MQEIAQNTTCIIFHRTVQSNRRRTEHEHKYKYRFCSSRKKKKHLIGLKLAASLKFNHKISLFSQKLQFLALKVGQTTVLKLPLDVSHCHQTVHCVYVLVLVSVFIWLSDMLVFY